MLKDLSYPHLVLAALMAATLGCATLNKAQEPSDNSFCAEWAELDDSARQKIVYDFAERFANSGDSPPSAELLACVQQQTDEFVKEDGAYYLCNVGQDFVAGRILGQAEATSWALCWQNVRQNNNGN